MIGSRPRYGLAISALGAVVLAVAVFLPWYGVSFTAHGLALAQRVGDQLVAQYGNAALQAKIASLHVELSGFAGREIGSLSAHQALSTLNVVLLVIAGLAGVTALLGLAHPAAASNDANRVPLAALGVLAAGCVLYRIVVLPTPPGQALALTLREGAWLALLGALAIVVGALWPTGRTSARADADELSGALAALSGWTPQA
jgi:hypothetical protein